MKSVRGFALGLAALAVMALMMIPSGAIANVGDRGATVTVGDFLQSYAKALKIELPANAGNDTVVAALKASGVKLDADIDPAKPLTQGEVVKIGKANGLRLTTNKPEAAFTPEEVDQFFTSYGYTQNAGQSATDLDRDAESRRKRKKKKKKKKTKSPHKMP
jgi:hypothetical protein